MVQRKHLSQERCFRSHLNKEKLWRRGPYLWKKPHAAALDMTHGAQEAQPWGRMQKWIRSSSLWLPRGLEPSHRAREAGEWSGTLQAGITQDHCMLAPPPSQAPSSLEPLCRAPQQSPVAHAGYPVAATITADTPAGCPQGCHGDGTSLTACIALAGPCKSTCVAQQQISPMVSLKAHSTPGAIAQVAGGPYLCRAEPSRDIHPFTSSRDRRPSTWELQFFIIKPPFPIPQHVVSPVSS